MSNSIKIAIDVMGSDKGPELIISGAALSKERNPESEFIFFGDYNLFSKLVKKFAVLDGSFEVIGTDYVVSPDDKPSAVLRKSKNTSMGKSLGCLQNKQVEFLFLLEILEL